jgi:hypothetical protein
MLIERIENETLIRIPNTMLDSVEVKTFMSFLEKNVPTKVSKKVQKTQDLFEELFQKWKSETALFSSATAIVSHSAYLKMILMGDVVIPFMLIKLQKDPQHLFTALYQITGENPVPYAHAGDLKKMTADWLNWGQTKGYLN